jgi:hypothetical protein
MERSTEIESFTDDMYALMRDGNGKGCAELENEDLFD